MTSTSLTDWPTDEIYGFFQVAYDHFSRSLFDDALPKCVLTLQRKRNVMGYASSSRWGRSDGAIADELAINPAYFFTTNVIQVFQSLVHEQCHIWQFHFGTPSRRFYHNTEWADKMESVGLMPSSTGAPGGRRTGQSMSDYPIEGGQFLNSSRRFIKSNHSLNWVDRLPANSEPMHERPSDDQQAVDDSLLYGVITDLMPNLPEQFEPEIKTKSSRAGVKVKYRCIRCQVNVWGKPGLKIICGSCKNSFSIVKPTP